MAIAAKNSKIFTLKVPEEDAEKWENELTASLRYASKIQNALFPTIKDFQKVFQESFVLYMPRDIVSGDFYWIHKRKNKIVVAAADCTGHGVPGAFLSLLGITFLKEIIAKDPMPAANKILNILREKVMKAMHQTDEDEPGEGMDIALYIIDETTHQLQFAGAVNPLYLIRDNSITVCKGDRMPIGICPDEEQSFINKTLQLEQGDTIYIFSDGFADQFGGPNEEKYKYYRFRELLLKIQKYSMRKQEDMLKKAFLKWKSNNKQVDDVMVIGVRYNLE